MNAKLILVVLSLALAMSSSGLAQGPITVIELINHLDESARDCDWKARNLTGAPKLKMLMHKRTMDDVLDALRAGREGDPKKIEEALNGHSF